MKLFGRGSKERRQADRLFQEASERADLPLNERIARLERAAAQYELADHVPGQARALYMAGVFLAMQGESEQALPRLLQARALAERANDQEVVGAATNTIRQLRDLEPAVAARHSAAGSAGHTTESAEESYILELNRDVQLLMHQGRFAQALPQARTALADARRLLGDEHFSTAISLSNLAGIYERLGDYGQALPLYEETVALARRTLGEEHPSYAAILNNLAILYKNMGDYARALPLSEQALALRRRTSGEEHPEVAASLNNLAILYEKMGDYQRAVLLHEQGLALRRRLLGDEHPDVATDMDNLAIAYQRIGDYARAIPLHRQAVALFRRVLGEDHPDVQIALDNLATAYQETGDFAQALPLAQQALAQARRALGDDHPEVTTCLNNLGLLYMKVGGYDRAQPLLEQALATSSRTVGDDHPLVATNLENLASLHAACGRPNDAMAHLLRAVAIEDRLISQVFSVGDERQRLALLATLRINLDWLMTLVLNHFAADSAMVGTAIDVVLRRKALTAEALGAQRDAVLGGRYPHLQPLLAEVTALRRQIVTLTFSRHGGADTAADREELSRLRGRQSRLEAELARQIPEMRLEERLHAADRRAVALALPPGATLVEFVRFDVPDFAAVEARGEAQWLPARYAAFVLSESAPDRPEFVDLGPAASLDALIATFRNAMVGDDDASGRGLDRGGEALSDTPTPADTREVSSLSDPLVAVGVALRARVFDPLRDALDGRTRLLIAPDGDLARLPFEVLPASGSGFLIDAYEISYVSTGRDLLRFASGGSDTPARVPSPPVVIADPDFDLAAAGGGEPAAAPEVVSSTRGRHSRDLREQSARFERLAGTRGEGIAVAARLGVEPWLAAAAVDGRLKTCRSPQVLHLATHGFFLPDVQTDPHVSESIRNRADDTGFGRLARAGYENPLLRSGLALAGVNTFLRGGALPEEAEDGLLTAEDVTGLDLTDTDLVVLSACETGVGQIRTGEGVFGLRRSFVVAGAKTLVMSLWEVPDRPTQQLMTALYDGLVGGGYGRAEALRRAQQVVRARYTHPYFWGAFICQGDPAPLVLWAEPAAVP